MPAMPHEVLCVAVLAFAFALSPSFAQRGSTSNLYVATNGNDRWSGRLPEPNAARTDGPVASLARVRDEIRQIKRRLGRLGPVTVMVRDGVYVLSDTFALEPEDSGSNACPITYQAYPGERVVIRGGQAVREWQRWRGSIYRADLKEQGMAGASFRQLFYRGERQILARHPNFDPKHPRTGGFAYVEATGPKPSAQFFYEQGSMPFEQWDDISQAEVLTVFALGWNFAITPVLNVDTKNRLVTVRRVRSAFQPENRFIVRNVLAALDAPGEWYLDRKTSTLYFWPPDNKLGDGEVVVPLIDCLIEAKGTIPYPHGYLKVGFKGSKQDFPMPADTPAARPVENLTFRGFRLECARQDALRFVGARRCAVVGCEVTNVGNVGINLGGVASGHAEVGNPRVTEAKGFFAGVAGGGQNLLFNDPCQECRVVGNDVWSLGSDGIFLYGTGNLAENNHVYDTGLFDKDCACINAFGEDNVVRRNELHDVPRNAVFLKGIGNVIELNNIHHTMLETCDGGAIRMCQRNLKIRGNVIRFNRIVDTVGYGYPRGRDYQWPYYSWGVYLDDFTCGTTVHGNIIVRTGRGGAHVHGGSDNVVTNNIIVDAGQYQYENNPIRESPATGNVVERNIFYYDGTESVLYSCGQWRGVEQVVWRRNLVWTRKGQAAVRLARDRIEGWDVWVNKGLAEGSASADPLFENPGADDFRLRPDSPAWKLGFKEIPVGRIGCYASPERAAWPLVVAPGLVRETPVAHKVPVRPLHEDFEWDAARRHPRQGDVMAPGKSSIAVTNECAAGGKKCLKFVDAPGLPQRWQPRIFYSMDFREGTVRFSCCLRLDGTCPPDMMIDFRQYADAGGREYLSGPMLTTNPKGELAAGGKVLTRVPFDQWIRLEVTMALGDRATKHYDLAVALPNAPAKRLQLPHRSPGFKWLQRVVIMSNSTTRTVFYVDELTCGPVDATPGQ